MFVATMLAVNVMMTSSYVLSPHYPRMKHLERAPLTLKNVRKASNTNCNALRMAVKEVKSTSELDSIVSAAGDQPRNVGLSVTFLQCMRNEMLDLTSQ